MPDPDPPGGRWPSPAARQVHAVLAWLVVEPELPNAVHLHLADALLAWAPLMGEHLFPTEPEAGVDADLRHLLEGMWWRLDAQAAEARWGRQGRAERGARPGRPGDAGTAGPAPTSPGLPGRRSP